MAVLHQEVLYKGSLPSIALHTKYTNEVVCRQLQYQNQSRAMCYTELKRWSEEVASMYKQHHHSHKHVKKIYPHFFPG